MITNALRIGADVLPDNFPPLAAFTVPTAEGLKALYLPTASLPVRNWIDDVDSPIVGSVAGKSGYVTVADGSLINTLVPEGASMTLLAAYRRISGNAGIIGSYRAAGNEGVGAFAVTGTNTEARVQQASGSAASISALGNTGAWTLMSIVAPASGLARLTDHTSGNAGATTSITRGVTGTDTVTLGGFWSSGFRAAVDIAFGAVFDRAVSTEELADLAAWARQHCAGAGISL